MFIWFLSLLGIIPAEARFNKYTVANQVQYFNDSCLEIGRTAVMPSKKVCPRVTRVVYKSTYCYGCPEAKMCNPACKGGKVCINQRCVCQMNKNEFDCKGKCVTLGAPCNLE